MVLRLIDSSMPVGLDRPGARLTVAWVAALCWRVPRIESRFGVRAIKPENGRHGLKLWAGIIDRVQRGSIAMYCSAEMVDDGVIAPADLLEVIRATLEFSKQPGYWPCW